MTKALRIEPDIGLDELLEVTVSSDWSVQFQPMLQGPGGRQGGTFIRSAAPWKGFKKNDGESYSDYISRLEDAGHDGPAAGLEALQEMRQNAGGLDNADGVSVVQKNGRYFPIPHAAAKMGVQAGNLSIENTYNDANEALDALRKKHGETAALPSVY